MTDSRKGAALAGGLLVAALLAALLLFPALRGSSAPADAPPRLPAERAHAPVEPGAARNALQNAPGDLKPPTDDHLRLTVPALDRVDDVPVPTAPGTEEGPLRDGAMHVEGTGFPWQEGANTYIAGHRLGFPGTRSDRLFWDLDELESGDRVILEDSGGRRYEYAVFRQKVVGPREISIADPVPGKSVVSLQTCTLPNYSDRLVVQAALVFGPQQASSGEAPAG
jgi:sortase A